MKTPRAFKLVALLTPEERRNLNKFVRSPFFNYQTALLDLLAWIIKVPEKKSENYFAELDPLLLYQVAYPEEKTALPTDKKRTKKVYNILSDLALLIEEFIAVTALRKDPLRMKFYHATFLSTRGDKAFFLTDGIKRLEKEIPSCDSTQEQLYFNYLKDKTVFASPHTNRMEKGAASKLLASSFSNLRKAFYLAQLGQWCDLLNRSNFLNEALEEEDKQAILSGTEQILEQERDAVVRMYGSLIGLFSTKGNLEALKAARAFLEQNFGQLSFVEQNECTRYLLNYCTDARKYGDGKTFSSQHFEIATWGIRKRIFVGPDGLSDDLFINTALIAIDLGKKEATEAFIKDYEKLLPPGKRANAVRLVEAHLFYFCDKDPEAADRKLKQIDTIEHKYLTRKHWLHIRIVYDLCCRDLDEQALDAAMRAYYDWLANNQQMKEEAKDLHRRLIRYIGKMFQYGRAPNAQRQKMIMEIKEELARDHFLLQDWVEERLGALA